MKKKLHVLAAIMCIAPIIYLVIVFPNLPQQVPTHFDLTGKPDRWSTRQTFLYLMVGLSIVNALIYLLLCNVHRIDPKRKAAANRGRLQKMGIAIIIFMMLVQLWIIYSTQQVEVTTNPRFIFIALGFLLAIIGNYMENIKPNYFAGLRLPWTLENEENWRKTHHYASKIWFYGGLVMAVLSFFIPLQQLIFLLAGAIVFMTLLPAIYSYRLYRKNKQNFVA